MHTMTSVRIGFPSTGRMTMRSMSEAAHEGKDDRGEKREPVRRARRSAWTTRGRC